VELARLSMKTFKNKTQEYPEHHFSTPVLKVSNFGFCTSIMLLKIYSVILRDSAK